MTQTNDCSCSRIVEVDTRLTRTESDVVTLRSDFDRLREAVAEMKTSFALLEQRVAQYAAMGGIVGGIATAIVIAAIQKFLLGG